MPIFLFYASTPAASSLGSVALPAEIMLVGTVDPIGAVMALLGTGGRLVLTAYSRCHVHACLPVLSTDTLRGSLGLDAVWGSVDHGLLGAGGLVALRV